MGDGVGNSDFLITMMQTIACLAGVPTAGVAIIIWARYGPRIGRGPK